MFAKADLSVFKGISGTLSSHGYFGGTLGAARRQRRDRHARLHDRGGRPSVSAVREIPSADRRHQRRHAPERSSTRWFLSSYLHATGAVLDAPKGHDGRTVTLDVAMDKSRIEDIMTMVVKTASPPMVGALKLNDQVRAAAGRERRDRSAAARRPVLDRQGAVHQLRRAGQDRRAEQTRPRQDGGAGEGARRRPTSRAASSSAAAASTLPEVSFDVPGARVELAGTYALKPETLDFKGQLLLDAKISQTVTGWKSLLLKVVDPLFKQKDGSRQRHPHQNRRDRATRPTSASTSGASSIVEISQVTTSCNPHTSRCQYDRLTRCGSSGSR